MTARTGSFPRGKSAGKEAGTKSTNSVFFGDNPNEYDHHHEHHTNKNQHQPDPQGARTLSDFLQSLGLTFEFVKVRVR